MTFVDPGSRIAVTGATGFVGKALVEHLADSGYRVIGISERQEPPSSILELLDDYVCADLTRGWPDIGPFTGLVHLAGLAAVQPSFERPQQYLHVNSSMVTHLFEHLLRADWTGRAIIVSSGAVYGSVNETDSSGVDECSNPSATSPYVVSKILVENQVEYYRRQGIEALVVRPFNHIGPGQDRGFIVPDLFAKVVGAEPGERITVGNLDYSRDYTDVRDIVHAYRLLLELRDPRDATYNVCSGTAHSGQEVLEAICKALGTPIPSTRTNVDRTIDPQVIIGSAERLRSETGWRPTIHFQKSVDDFVRQARSCQCT